MSVRTTPIGDTIVIGSGIVQPGISVQAQLIVPAGAQALDTAGEVIDLAALTTVTDGSGIYLFDPAATPGNGLIAPGDIRQWSGGSLMALAGCFWRVSYLTTTIDSPGFAYSASTLNPSAWVGGPVTLGLIKMWLTDVLGNAQGVQGRTFTIQLNQDAVWTGGAGTGQKVTASASIPVNTDSSGNFYIYLQRQSELNPSTGFWYLTEQSGSTPWTFTTPTLYTGDAGSWLVGTTYALNAVVRDPATDIPYISLAGGNIGHALTDATKWAVYAGEKITSNLHPIGLTGTHTWTTADLAHDANLPVILDDAVSSPSTLHDDIANIARRTGFATAAKTTTYATTNTDDWLFVSGASGAWNLTVQAASTRTRPLYVFLTDATHAVTLLRTGSDTFNGATSLVLSTLYQWVCLKPPISGTAWAALIPGSGGGVSAPSYVWLAKSANYTALITDTNILVDASGGAVTITLFTAVGYTGRISIKKKDSSANAVNIKTVSAQTIDGVNYATSPLPITTQYASVSLVGDNSAFWIE